MTDPKSIRILLVDDHAIVREGYRSLLQKQMGMEVVGEAADGAEAYSRFKDCNPDVVIMDISLPGQGGLEAIALQELTVREFEILRLLVEARSTDDIAQTLNISPKTVSNCHYLIKRKLGVASDIELTHLAIRMNVINLLELSGPLSKNSYIQLNPS